MKLLSKLFDFIIPKRRDKIPPEVREALRNISGAELAEAVDRAFESKDKTAEVNGQTIKILEIQ